MPEPPPSRTAPSAFCCPGAPGAAADETREVAFVAAECLLGEAALDRFVDEIAWAPEPPRDGEDVPLAELAERFAAALERQRFGLPARPRTDRTGEPGFVLKLEPTEQPDYPRQADLFVAKTEHLPMWRHAHSGYPFSSERFSRCGETFCYVKTDGSGDLGGFPDKASIEDALEGALEPARLGAVIGGGTGLRYSYVDLALSDVDRAIPAIRHALRAGRIPTRAWLQFFDDELAAEWVGVYDGGPAPPGYETGA